MMFRRRRVGFTLVEMIVVISIIAVLAALLVPMVYRATQKASAARIAADLQTIGNALDAYKLDFGDYPRLPLVRDPVRDNGPNLLAWALIGPYNATRQGNDSAVPVFDGAIGPGFRVRPQFVKDGTTVKDSLGNDVTLYGQVDKGPDGQYNTSDDTGYQGRVYGPYIAINKFPLSPITTGKSYQQLLDGYGNPILYFPARPGVAAFGKPTGTIVQDVIIPSMGGVLATGNGQVRPVTINVRDNYVGSTDRSLFNIAEILPTNAAYKEIFFPTLPMKPTETQPPEPRVLRSPSDANYLGSPGPGQPLSSASLSAGKIRSQVQYRLEQAGDFAGPYILWSAGPDGVFFTPDDVTNFSSASK